MSEEKKSQEGESREPATAEPAACCVPDETGVCQACTGNDCCPPAQAGAVKPAGRGGKKTVKKIVINFVLGIFLGAAIIAAVVLMMFSGVRQELASPSRLLHNRVLGEAAVVNGHPIKYADYASDLATARHFFDKSKQQDPQTPTPSESDLRTGVLDRLIQNEIIEEEAAKRHITVGAKDLDDEFSKLTASNSGTDPAAQIQDLYGWTVAQFKEKVMRPYLLEQKIGEALASDAQALADAQAKAQGLLDRIKAGEDFGGLAKQFSDDKASAVNGGDLGWFTKGTMVKEFENAAFALKKGEVSDLVKTQYGYHIIKVTDIEKDKKTGETTRVQASHILIALPDVQTYIDGLIKDAKVVKYVDINGGDQAAPAVPTGSAPTK